MIDYLLDTNAVISILANRSQRLLGRIRALQPGQIGLSAIVVHELQYGAYKSQNIDFNLETIRRLLADLAVIELDRQDARAAGEIRATLARKVPPIGTNDILIAGQAAPENSLWLPTTLRNSAGLTHCGLKIGRPGWRSTPPSRRSPQVNGCKLAISVGIAYILANQINQESLQ